MWFYGSAMRIPHSQGAFREQIVVEEFQCEPVGDTVSLGEAACCEPLSVALHAVTQAGSLAGKRVLVTGSGPIGALVVAAARFAGALEVVATDLHDAALAKAIEMGATRTVNVALEPGLKAEEFTADKGYFDVAIECTGAAPRFCATSFQHCVRAERSSRSASPAKCRSRSTPSSARKSIWRGAFRFHGGIRAAAARLIKEGRINVKPIITATLPISRAVEAFELAADRRAQMKVQLTF